MADQKYMDKVMKLLERAGHPETSEAEARLCEEKAEQLMALHMIDRMDLKPEQKTKIVNSTWNIRIGDSSVTSREEFNYEWANNILGLAQTVLLHCNVRVHPTVKYGKGETRKGINGQPDHTPNDYSIRVLEMVGYPEDIEYANRIWFNVYKTFVMNISPQWRTDLSLGENCYYFLKAGFKWGAIWKMAFDNQALRGGFYTSSKGSKIVIPDPRQSKYCTALKSAVKDYCDAKGEVYQAHTQRHDHYRSSFARSFDATIRQRLERMRAEAKRQAAEQNGTAADNTNGDRFAVALRDTKQAVDEEFYRLFPEYDPEVQRQKQEARDFEAACKFAALPKEEQERLIREEKAESDRAYARWVKDSTRARRNYNTVRNTQRSNDNIDVSAWERGREMANTVNLRADAEVKKERVGEING